MDAALDFPVYAAVSHPLTYTVDLTTTPPSQQINKPTNQQAQELSKASQAHAEAAARDLLAAKRAELQVLPLLTGGKNPDPAAAELLKAQVAAKCAEQLKVRCQ